MSGENGRLTSGERFRVEYLLQGDEAAARATAREVCVEQTVEFPEDLLPRGPIPDEVVGRLESLVPAGPGRWRAEVSYAVETAAGELTQLLNVILGNSSMRPGVRVERFVLTDSLLAAFPGPRFGRAGLRRLTGVERRPLLCTALKPMGLAARALAEQAHAFALGGMDLVKDDHGVTDQRFSPYAERVPRCAEAIARANARTGRSCLYVVNVTAPVDQVLERAHLAKRAGAGGLMIAPALCGFDTVRLLAADASLAMPILSHPTFGGSYVTSPQNGMSHAVLYGHLPRLAGADATIFVNYGGRFPFSREDCAEIARASAAPMGRLPAIFPAPGGGMTAERIPDLLEVYGRDFLLLVGGGMHRLGPDLTENARRLLQLAEGM